MLQAAVAPLGCMACVHMSALDTLHAAAAAPWGARGHRVLVAVPRVVGGVRVVWMCTAPRLYSHCHPPLDCPRQLLVVFHHS